MRPVPICATVGAATLTACVVSACTLVAPLDGLSGNVPSTERTEASTEQGAGSSDAHSSDSPNLSGTDATAQDAPADPAVTDVLEGATTGTDVLEGGPTDTGGPDGGRDGGMDPCATALFCDDFEQDLQLGLWPSQSVAGGTIAVDNIRSHGGSRALHAHIDAVDGGSTPGVSVIHSSALPSDYFIRVWMFAASPAPGIARNLVSTLQAQAPYWGMSLGINFDGTLAITAWTDSASSYDNSHTTSPALDRWVCLEWEVTENGSLGATHVWMDGNAIGDLALSNLPAAPFGQMGLGVSFYQATTVPANDTWFDDLVVATSFVPCSP
jgi:hypothetical protein